MLLSVACEDGKQASLASFPLFIYQVDPLSKGHVYTGSLHEAVCSQLPVLYEAVFNPRIII